MYSLKGAYPSEDKTKIKKRKKKCVLPGTTRRGGHFGGPSIMQKYKGIPRYKMFIRAVMGPFVVISFQLFPIEAMRYSRL
jgi:hypothetical protein